MSQKSSLRFNGLVKKSRECRQKLTDGIPVARREAFLASVQKTIKYVESVCKQHGLGPKDLPAPSRSALRQLRDIADIPLDELPEPSLRGNRVRPIQIPHIVRGLKDFQLMLAHAHTASLLNDVYDAICRCTGEIETLCRYRDSSPAGLPAPSARAFAMTKWLSIRDNFDRYVNQVKLARSTFEPLMRKRETQSARLVEILFCPTRYLWSLRTDKHAYTWQLALGFLNADPTNMQDLAHLATTREKAPDDVLERHHSFVDSPEFGLLEQELCYLADLDVYEPNGRAWNLDEIFTSLNGQFFDHQLPRPNLHWYHSTSTQQFGFYDKIRDLIGINQILDDPKLPEYVPRYVLYHEMLHKKHMVVRNNGRRSLHTAEFERDMRRFAEKWRAEQHLSKLYSGRCCNCGHSITADERTLSADTSAHLAHRSVEPVLPAESTAADPPSRAHTGRNAPCPCGSGRKYKKCCGKQ